MDRISPGRRSANMRAIRAKNTAPEIVVRTTLRQIGFPGYRLHRKELPGKPDIVFVGHKKAIFIHGCFWHGHDCREGQRRPLSRQDYWVPKIAGNQARDIRHQAALAGMGWDSLAIWECEVNRPDLSERLQDFLKRD